MMHSPLCVCGLVTVTTSHGGAALETYSRCCPGSTALSSQLHRLQIAFRVDVPLQLFAFCATSLPPLDLWLALPSA